MKTKLIKKHEKDFPKLMMSKTTDEIVLFTETNKGTIIHGKYIHSIGIFSNDWDITNFVEFNGVIEISN